MGIGMNSFYWLTSQLASWNLKAPYFIVHHLFYMEVTIYLSSFYSVCYEAHRGKAVRKFVILIRCIIAELKKHGRCLVNLLVLLYRLARSPRNQQIYRESTSLKIAGL